MPRGRSCGGPSGRGASRRGVTSGRDRRTQAAPYSVPTQRGRRTQRPPQPPTNNQVITSPPAATVQAASPPPPDAANSAAERQVSDLSMADFLQTIRDIVRNERPSLLPPRAIRATMPPLLHSMSQAPAPYLCFRRHLSLPYPYLLPFPSPPLRCPPPQVL